MSFGWRHAPAEMFGLRADGGRVSSAFAPPSPSHEDWRQSGLGRSVGIVSRYRSATVADLHGLPCCLSVRKRGPLPRDGYAHWDAFNEERTDGQEDAIAPPPQ